MPLRIAFATPNIVRNGVFRWITDLVAHTDPTLIEWVGAYVPGTGQIDPRAASELARYMPIFCGDVEDFRLTAASDHVTFGESAEMIDAACRRADGVLTWQMEDGLEPFVARGVHVLRVSHSTWWQPKQRYSRGIQDVAVSHVAACALDEELPYVLSGVELDRCLPTVNRERARWALGLRKPTLLYVGRNDPSKAPDTVSKLARKLDFEAIQVGDFEGYVEGTRRIPWRNHLGDILLAADVLVSTSPEAFGNSVVEAWMVGTPTLIHQTTGAWEAVRDRKPAGVARHSGEMAEMAELAEALAKGPRFSEMQYVREHLCANSMTRRWERFLQQSFRPTAHARPKPTIRTRYGERPPRILYLHPDPPVIDGNNLLIKAPWNGEEEAGRLLVKSYERTVDAIYTAKPDSPAFDEATVLVLREQNLFGIAGYLQASAPKRPPMVDHLPRILFLMPSCGFGGSEVWLKNIAARQRELGWSVRVVCAGKRLNVQLAGQLHAEEPDALPEIFDAGVDAIVFWGIEHVGKLIPKGFAGRIVCVSHGTEHCRWTKRWLKDSCLMATDLVAVSHAAVRAYPWYLHEKVDVIYQGVEFPELVRAESNGITVGYVGRSEAAKDPLLAAEVVKALGKPYRLLHCGDLSEYEGGDLRATIYDMLGDRATVLGHTDHAAALIRTSVDVLLSPAKAESAGLAIMETLAAGKAVVCTPRCIISEFTAAELAAAQEPTIMVDSVLEVAKRLRPDKEFMPFVGPLPERFELSKCVNDFNDYLLERIARSDTPGTPLYTLSARNPPPEPRLSGEHVVCDALVLVDHETTHASLLATVETLLKQKNAMVFVHLLGPSDVVMPAYNGLSREFPIERVRGHVTDQKFGQLDGIAHILPKLLTDFVVVFGGSDVVAPNFMGDAVSMLQTGALEVLLQGNTLAIRRGTVIDLQWLDDYPTTVEGLVELCVRRNTTFLRTPGPVAYSHAPMSCGGDLDLPDWATTVDIVLPFHGQLQYVREAIAGLNRQERCHFHLHLIDDASTEAEAVDELFREARQTVEFGEVHNTLSCWRTPHNIGQFMAVNAVVKHLENEVFLVHDGDDISLPNRAYVSSATMALTRAGLFTGAAKLFGGGPHTLLPSYPYPHCRYYAINPATAIRKSEFSRLGGYADAGSLLRNRTSLDTDFFVRAYAAGVNVQISNLPLVEYRQHPQSCVQAKETGFKSEARHYVETQTARSAARRVYPPGALAAAPDLIPV